MAWNRRRAFWAVVGAGIIAAIAGLVLRRHPTESSWLQPLAGEYQRKLSQIHVGEGVDSSGAAEIASMYMSEYVSGCGFPEPLEPVDDKRVGHLRVGHAGTRSESAIKVDAQNSGVFYADGPTFTSLRDVAEDLLGGISARRR